MTLLLIYGSCKKQPQKVLILIISLSLVSKDLKYWCRRAVLFVLSGNLEDAIIELILLHCHSVEEVELLELRTRSKLPLQIFRSVIRSHTNIIAVFAIGVIGHSRRQIFQLHNNGYSEMKRNS